MINYSFTNSIDFDFNATSEYVYDFYKNDERVLNDNVIKNNDINPFSFISLDVQFKAKYDNRILTYFNYVRENLQEINDLSLQEGERLHDLSKNELALFNKVSDIENHFISINSDIFKSNIDEINNYSEVVESNHLDAIRFITNNKKIEINREIKQDFLESNKDNLFFTNSVSESLEKFEDLFRQDEIDYKNSTFINIANGFTPLKTHPVSQYSLLSENFYYCCVGILVEKYNVDETNETPIKKDTKFFANTRQNLFEGFRYENSFSINDTAVKYGSEYFYAIYPVYAMTLPKKNDYYLVETFLVCDFPYFTENVVCKEFKRPVCPSNLSFKYLSSLKSLKISWSKPFELQGDIKGYQIFKRKDISQPYTLLKQIEFFEESDFYERNINVSRNVIEKSTYNKTICIDEDFNINEVQIYTICAIDARGYSSNYSEQIAVYYDYYTKDLIVDLVSRSGAPLHMPNLLLPRKTKFIENEEKIISNTPYEENVKKISLYITPEYKEINDNEDNNPLTLLKEKYKFSIFKLENSQQIIEDINIILE